jgi:hypothetical protein
MSKYAIHDWLFSTRLILYVIYAIRSCINLVLDAMFWHNDEIKLIDIFEI